MQNKTRTEDLILVNKALKNRNQFALLIEKYEEKLMRYVYRLTGFGRDNIEDILQEIFIKIYKNLNNFDQDLKFSSWAYRIAHNETLNYARKYRGKETISIESNNPDTANLIDILKDDTDIEKETRQKELAYNVRKALNKLHPKYRDVLVLYYLEEKDYAEISDIIKKPMGTVATLLNRAKKKFREIAKHLKPELTP